MDSKSTLESMFLDRVREAALPLPQLNVLVEGYLVDAYWPRAGLVVELQSYEHHAHRQAFERDNSKLTRLQVAGHAVLPLTHRKLRDQPGEVVGAVRSISTAAAAPPRRPVVATALPTRPRRPGSAAYASNV